MAASLIDIKGVGPTLARLLTEAGFTDFAAVASADVEALVTINGIGPRSAASIRADAQRLTAGSAAAPGTSAPAADSEKKKAKKLRRQARQLRAQAKQLTKKAGSTKSKKKRKRHLREAAQLEDAAKRKRRKAKKLLSG